MKWVLIATVLILIEDCIQVPLLKHLYHVLVFLILGVTRLLYCVRLVLYDVLKLLSCQLIISYFIETLGVKPLERPLGLDLPLFKLLFNEFLHGNLALLSLQILLLNGLLYLHLPLVIAHVLNGSLVDNEQLYEILHHTVVLVETQMLPGDPLVHSLPSLLEIHVLQELGDVERDVIVVEHAVLAKVLLAL